MQKYTDEQILQGIKDHNAHILKYLYKEYFAFVRNFILKSKGGEDEAKDLFQEAIIIIYKKVRDNDFKLDKSFKNYFFVMIKLLWFKRQERDPKSSDDQGFIETIIDDDQDIIEKYSEARKYKLFQKHFKKLRDDCKKILTMVMKKVPLKAIAKKIGSKSENYVKKRKHKCKEFLIESIKSDPDYTNIYDS